MDGSRGDRLVHRGLHPGRAEDAAREGAAARCAPRQHGFDGRFEVPTLDEVLALVRRENAATGTSVGVYPETKHPTYFGSIGLPLEEPLLAITAPDG